MEWVKDRTGRLNRRPHYSFDELDCECERLIHSFLLQRHATVAYPISTDDLTVLIETLVDDLDLYSDLSGEQGQVEGVTDFYVGRRPRVRISKELTSNPRLHNRLRTTLTHELGHVVFHAALFEALRPLSLFDSCEIEQSNRCKRDSILRAPQYDWMEWQAAFACGAFLVPASSLKRSLQDFMQEIGIPILRLNVSSPEADRLIVSVATEYEVSRDAARVRLAQKGVLVETEQPQNLFQ